MLDLHKSFYFLVRNFLVRKKGASAVTYALLIMMVASGAIVTFSITGGSVEDVFELVTGEIDPAAGTNGGGEGGAGGDAPTFTVTIPDATIAENGTYGPTGFTIADSDTDVGSLTVTATTSNAGIVPPNRIDLGGSGGSRTISLTPEPNASGTVTITVTVSDGTNTGSDSFVLTITPDAAPDFIAVGRNATIGSSTDGTTWSSQQVGDSAGFLWGVAYDGTTYVASGRNGSSNAVFYTSTDGTSWTAATGAGGVSGPHTRVIYAGGKFVANSVNGDYISYSSNGNDWTSVSLGSTVSATGIAYGNGTYVVSGYDGFAYSTDLTNWTAIDVSAFDLNNTRWLEDIAYGNGYFVAAGYDDNYFPFAIYASATDVTNWTAASFPTVTTDHDIYGIGFGNGNFLAVGFNGVIWTSSNGVSWTKSLFDGNYYWNDADFAGGRYVVVGNGGDIITSTDLSTWTPQNSGTANNFYGVIGGNSSANGGASDPDGNASPVISTPIPDSAISPGDTFGPENINVADDSDAPGDLDIAATSSNPTLVPDGNIIIDQTGPTPTITINPEPGEEGATTIEVVVTDSGGRPTTMVFDLLVTNQQKLLASNGASNDNFGNAVDIDGTRLVVAAKNKPAVYVFELSGGTWSETSTISLGGGSTNPRALALSGNTIVIGRSGSDQALVYVESGGSWSLQQTLTASDAGSVDEFGWSVDISGDTLIVGAPDAGLSGLRGAAYVFDRSGSVWSQTSKLVSPTDNTTGNRFGYEVGIGGSPGSKFAMVTQNDISSNKTAFFSEASSWISVFSHNGPSSSDYGRAASMSSTGNIAATGDPYNGGVYVFTESGGAFSLTQTINVPGGGDYCGEAVGVSSTHVLIGCPGDGGSTTFHGYARLYTPSGTLVKTINPYDGGSDWNEFGYDTAIDGSNMVIGTEFDDDKASNAGAAYTDSF